VGNRGNHLTGWNELNGFLMSLEIPGIYLQTDGDLFSVFDQINARIISRDDQMKIIEIENPTEFDAKISVLAETVSQSKKPLGSASFLNWPKIKVNAGEKLQVQVSVNGKVSQL